MFDRRFQRVVVVGTSCSGKTTFARQLAQALRFTHIELDAIYWKPNWRERPVEEFRALVEKAVAGESWVIDGNYSKVRDIVWNGATHIIWLNYPFFLVFRRAIRRTVRRIVFQEELFSGNRENWRQAFLSRDSILWWVITTHRRRRREYPAFFKQMGKPHLAFIELRSQRQADAFFLALKERAA